MVRARGPREGGVFEHMLVTFRGLNLAKTKAKVEGQLMGQAVTIEIDPDLLAAE